MPLLMSFLFSPHPGQLQTESKVGFGLGRGREELLIGKNGIFGPSLLTTGFKIPWDMCQRTEKCLKGLVLFGLFIF